ncbi:unnamed protein product [Cuscuta epithymum]|uniref:F-box/LRR-repeat protein 15/At3g58940/PEG3-like LRR domain-containing protein n=1 Tax=Cuscuta epithymum TaxID=186058 RepID=A0AAV0CVC8_9ASTE|nr:unnamed protein product [Cuscuta epithymum]
MAQRQEDRISALPDEVLINILSRVPMTVGCRTGVLSRRWENMWNQVSNVCFFGDYDDIVVKDVGPENGFFAFVDHVLNRCNSHKIDRFWIQFKLLDDKDSSRITNWVQFAVDRKADDIALMQQGAWNEVTLPEILVSYLPLKKLKLKFFKLGETQVINWPCLTRLTLRSVNLNDEEVERLLAGCPALETLELTHYGFFRELKIKSARVKTLILESCISLNLDYNNDAWLHIRAPHLQNLEVYGEADCRLVNVSSLVDATFDCEMKLDNINGFLPSASHARRLTFTSWFMEAFSLFDFNKVAASKFNCKELVLRGDIRSYNISGIARFILALPLLETLDMFLCSSPLLDTPKIFTGNEEYYDSNYHVCNAPVNNMKELLEESSISKGIEGYVSKFNVKNARLNKMKEVNFYHGYWCCSEDDFENKNELPQLAEFVLRRATNLERLCLVSRKEWNCRECSRNCVAQFFSELATKLHQCPKLSPNAVIHLSEFNYNCSS